MDSKITKAVKGVLGYPRPTHFDTAMLMKAMYGDELAFHGNTWYRKQLLEDGSGKWNACANGDILIMTILSTKVCDLLLDFIKSVKDDDNAKEEYLKRIVNAIEKFRYHPFKINVLKECKMAFYQKSLN